MRPRDELNIAVLRVEREILDVERAVCLDERRVHPQYRTVTPHDRIRHHIVVELVTGTETKRRLVKNTAKEKGGAEGGWEWGRRVYQCHTANEVWKLAFYSLNPLTPTVAIWVQL